MGFQTAHTPQGVTGHAALSYVQRAWHGRPATVQWDVLSEANCHARMRFNGPSGEVSGERVTLAIV